MKRVLLALFALPLLGMGAPPPPLAWWYSAGGCTAPGAMLEVQTLQWSLSCGAAAGYRCWLPHPKHPTLAPGACAYEAALGTDSTTLRARCVAADGTPNPDAWVVASNVRSPQTVAEACPGGVVVP